MKEVIDELEVKAKIDNIEEVRRRLLNLGAKLKLSEWQIDTYFKHPCRDLLAEDKALRLRITPRGAELTFKGPRRSGLIKARLEITVKVDDAKAMTNILQLLGFEEDVKVTKYREVYELRKYSVYVILDEVKDLGYFVEVEAKEATSDLYKVLADLGIQNIVKDTYAEMMRRGRKGSSSAKT